MRLETLKKKIFQYKRIIGEVVKMMTFMKEINQVEGGFKEKSYFLLYKLIQYFFSF